MSKCILVMDMPTLCHKCPLCTFHNVWYCEAVNKKIPYMTEKPSWCPLKEVPQKKRFDVLCSNEVGDKIKDLLFTKGYNDCIDEILGDGK